MNWTTNQPLPARGVGMALTANLICLALLWRFRSHDVNMASTFECSRNDVISTVGLPLEGAGLLLAIDPIWDMARTAVNVAGQALVPTIVAKAEGLLDLERFSGVPTALERAAAF